MDIFHIEILVLLLVKNKFILWGLIERDRKKTIKIKKSFFYYF